MWLRACKNSLRKCLLHKKKWSPTSNQMDGYWIHRGYGFFYEIWRVVFCRSYVGNIHTSRLSLPQYQIWEYLRKANRRLQIGNSYICNPRNVIIFNSKMWKILRKILFFFSIALFLFFRYDLMLMCWERDVDLRPSFIKLVESINNILATETKTQGM